MPMRRHVNPKLKIRRARAASDGQGTTASGVETADVNLMVGLVEAGKVRHIGLSEAGAETILCASGNGATVRFFQLSASSA